MGTTKLGLLLLSVFAMAAASSGCQSKGNPYGSSSGGSDAPPNTVPPPAPPVTANAPLALNIYEIFDNQNFVHNLVFQETGTSTCTASTATPVVTCTVSLPEGQTYYSNFTFQYSWMASACRIMIFQPYYYQRSASAGYILPGTTSPVDCSVLPTPPTCFNGAAVDLVPGFPVNRALLYTPDETDLNRVLTDSAKHSSAWSKNMLANNLWTINDMPLGKTGTAVYGTAVEAALPGQGSYPPLADPVKPHVGTDNYMANSMVNYQLSCRDNWFDLQTYTIHLNFVEEDSASGAGSVQNHFFTWKDLP